MKRLLLALFTIFYLTGSVWAQPIGGGNIGGSIATAPASTTSSGVVELATNAEAAAKTATDKVLVPGNIDSFLIDGDNWDSTDLAVADGGTGASDAAGAKTNLGFMTDLADDSSPQLGGDLDVNSHCIDFPTVADISDYKNENDMASNSATMLATQQSIKSYVDTQVSTKIADLVDDTSPQLGGDLDLNGHCLDFPTVSDISDCKDENDMASNSSTMLATQSSIKAYVDSQVGGKLSEVVEDTTPQLGGDLDTNSHNITGYTISRALISDSSGYIAVSDVTTTELGYLDGVSSDIQSQINGKEGTLTNEAGLYSALSDVTQFWEAGDSVTGAIGSDEAYGSGWDSDTSVPEKDDIYDYLHNFDADDDGSFTDESWYQVRTLDSSPDSDHTWNGEEETATAGEDLAIGDVCYLKSDGKYWKADSDAEATAKGSCRMATDTISADASGVFLIRGYIRDDTWDWTVGAELYIHTTGGNPTETKPSGAADCVRIIGYATTADIMWFDPDSTYVEIGS